MAKKFKVSAITMIQSLIWPGVCPGDKTISATKIKGLEMVWEENSPAIKLTAKGKTEWVPLGSISNYSTQDDNSAINTTVNTK
jgi:hypothetical protein